MTAIEPRVSSTGRYSVKEAAAILGINPKTLTEHANKGLIKYGLRKNNNRRFYSGQAIMAYWRQN